MEIARMIAAFGLEPGTCGYMGSSYVGAHGAALYFLVTPDRPGHVHRLDADQIYHFYAGDPLDVAFLAGDRAEVQTVGPFDHEGCVPQLIVPAGTVHGSKTRGRFTLACTTSFSSRRPLATTATEEQHAIFAAAGFA